MMTTRRRNGHSRAWAIHAAMALTVGLTCGIALAADATRPVVSDDLVFAERDGIAVVEAEHFHRQDLTEKRAFHITSADHSPSVGSDGDPPHVEGASGGAYVEVLPDTRRNHSEKLIRGENFSDEPGKLAVLTYRVRFTNPGRYYVWVRAYSTGTEDNGIHVGIDGQWPDSGRRMQWCEGKHSWRWESKQRTADEHCGEPHKIFLDVASAGIHEVHFSMREDGFEFDRWLMTTDRDFARPDGVGPDVVVHRGELPAALVPSSDPQKASRSDRPNAESSPTTASSDLPQQQPRSPDGEGEVTVEGEPKQWHKVTVTLDGPYAHELDNDPNPFVDYEMNVTFTHESGSPSYVVPGYFAADGDAAESSAEAGTKWRAHLSPDKPGRWDYKISFRHGETVIDSDDPDSEPLEPYDGKSGQFDVAPSDKSGRDLRAHGRLQYVKERYLKFAGTGEYFLKAGADAPETFLAYADFDATVAKKPQKSPLKTWGPHVQDWQDGNPTWQDGKGKGMIGAINYLSGKGCNAFSFLTYNAGGDGDNVWPFVERDDKMHYDCSKLDQWGIVFDHGTARGMYLHFKMQETENDDHRLNNEDDTNVPESLDGGDLGPQRRLYCRELIARFGHNLALNWNLGEENTQSTEQQKAMIDYLAQLDPYGHPIVVHTYPNRQDDVYRPLIGDRSKLTGVSLQNSNVGDTHWQVIKWVRESEQAGKPWVVAFDESGNASHGQPPDLGYKGFDGHDRQGKETYTEHRVRRETLWGTLLGGGAGVEYYFGYQFVENDLVCEDWRSRDRSWDYCRIALEFFRDFEVPFQRMRAADDLVGSDPRDNSRYCFADLGEYYLVYVANGDATSLDLSDTRGQFTVMWFNPRTGGDLARGSVEGIEGGGKRDLGTPPSDRSEDWLAVIRKR